MSLLHAETTGAAVLGNSQVSELLATGKGEDVAASIDKHALLAMLLGTFCETVLLMNCCTFYALRCTLNCAALNPILILTITIALSLTISCYKSIKSAVQFIN